MLNLLKRCWRGEASLRVAFWFVYGFLGLVLGIVIFIPFYLYVPQLLTSPDVLNTCVNVMNAISLPFYAFAMVCVWRCSENTVAYEKWSARLIVIITLLASIYSLFAYII